ncbi:hypothetical protein GCM10010990_28620 [Croceicoccus mobilis]|uniref:Uncharacterized protein n=1 Tax=Croceicoccus mobilis TaxID=1703339 RepID=A0A916Z680_9SPHN|nr:hypothetical protein GCM10010990_28620 [Croceicoccus mobilis]
MGDGDSRFTLKKQHRDGFADYIGFSDDNDIQARQVLIHGVQQFHDAQGRARDEATSPGRQSPDVDGVEAIDVFGWIDRSQYNAGVNMCRQGNLNQNTMDRRIDVETGYQGQQRFL